MARSYARLTTNVASDGDWISLTPMQQWAYTLVLRSPKLSLAGCVDVKLRQWAQLADGVTEAGLAALLDQLEDRGFVAWDRDTDELVVRTFVRNDDVLQNRNTGRGMWKAWQAIESPALRDFVLANLPEDAWEDRFQPAVPKLDRPDPPPDNDRSNGRSNDRSDDRSDGPSNDVQKTADGTTVPTTDRTTTTTTTTTTGTTTDVATSQRTGYSRAPLDPSSTPEHLADEVVERALPILWRERQNRDQAKGIPEIRNPDGFYASVFRPGVVDEWRGWAIHWCEKFLDHGVTDPEQLVSLVALWPAYRSTEGWPDDLAEALHGPKPAPEGAVVRDDGVFLPGTGLVATSAAPKPLSEAARAALAELEDRDTEDVA